MSSVASSPQYPPAATKRKPQPRYKSPGAQPSRHQSPLFTHPHNNNNNKQSKIMYSRFLVLCVVAVAMVAAQPAKNEFWKGTSMDAMVEQTKLECSQKNDEISCMKFKVLNLLDQLFRKDNFKVSLVILLSPIRVLR